MEVGPDEYLWRWVRFERCDNWRICPKLRHDLRRMRRAGWTIGPKKIDETWQMVVKGIEGEDSPWPLSDDYN
jgi:hypothetical protein